MKKITMGGLVIASCLLLSIGLVLNVSATEIKLTKDSDDVSFSTQVSTTIEDSLSRPNKEDWFYIEGVQLGLMSVEVSWGSSVDIDCYISTSASKLTYLARGVTNDNPESCSFNIETVGTYYIGIIMRSRPAVTTTYSALVTWYADSGEPDTTDPTVSITSPSDGNTVSNTISITATAEDLESGMDYVDCTFDGISLGTDSSIPYTWNFDTTSVIDGFYEIEVIAFDNAGNFATDTINIQVDNTSPIDTTDPTVSITSPNDGSTVGNTILITATAEDLESGMDYVDCTFDGISLGSDSSSPYAWNFDTKNVVNGYYLIEVIAYDNAGNSASDTISVEVFNDFDEGEKIAVFFWASDAGAQWVIDEYWTVLQAEGYTKMFNFEDTANFDTDFNTVEAYEDPEDTVFFYLFGHGNNNGEDSYTAFAPGTSIIYSSHLRELFDTLDAERLGFLIESCHSGGFPIDFQASPYLAMSTSDEEHNSYAISSIPGEGLFSDAFFNHVFDGFNAVESFDFAKQVVFDQARNDRFMQYPLIADYSDYVWFS